MDIAFYDRGNNVTVFYNGKSFRARNDAIIEYCFNDKTLGPGGLTAP